MVRVPVREDLPTHASANSGNSLATAAAWTSIAAVVIAVVSTVWSSWWSARLAKQAHEENVEDRKIRYELGVLFEMSRHIGPHMPEHGREHVRALRTAVPGVELPAIQRWFTEYPRDSLPNYESVHGEIQNAIRERTSSHEGQPIPPRPWWRFW